MATLDVAHDFDRISPQYDATRDPLDAATLDRLADRLRAAGVGSLLEIGVGTGRIARPLTDAGFRLTGVDASRGMLALARAKGLPRLVRGNAYRLPFADRAVDGALFVHVLHLLEDTRAALGEATRVGRQGAFALVHPAAPDADEARRGPGRAGREEFFRVLAERGYPRPSNRGGPPARERRLLEAFPPDRLEVVTDREVTEPVARRLRLFSQGASRHTLGVPPAVLQEAVAAALARVGDATVTFRRVEALAHWATGPAA